MILFHGHPYSLNPYILMNKLFTTLLLLMLTIQVFAQNKISFFSDHVYSIAQQEKIAFAEAAKRVRDLGYDGIDVRVTMKEEDVNQLDALGFLHPCCIADLHYVKGEQPEAEQQALDFARNHNYKLMLIVMDMLPENATDELRQTVAQRMDRFTKRAQAQGIDVVLEDYDSPVSPSYNSQAIDKIFQTATTLGHALDTGNYIYAKEDPLQAIRHFGKRVRHVHLKDRVSKDDMHCPAIGAGMLPLQQVITELRALDYQGWLTVEHYGSRQMLQDAATSIKNVRQALAQ